ncbi:hypothetical protein Vretifemale_4375 [Volvox reticuliferus]|uniref:Uncharacterized protein n=1 Tax=Volvox reticuliferus TaxID=1737510 RepID=A0A8J4FKD0_9CHLO|nr:hypothetical protein Vretifemale_4375 [Volvox reticuliferus]
MLPGPSALTDILYMYSPWAWQRSSPWDSAQQAPWDEQLGYPMYSWADVPVNGPGVRPRLRRMPPLFTRNPPEGYASTHGRLPVAYSEVDDLFAMSEEEVDDILECAQWCWTRMQRYRLVARFFGMDWSERGHMLLREGLLEVYRRHRVQEVTTSRVGDAGPKGESDSGKGALVAADAPSIPTASASGNPNTATGRSNDNGNAGADNEGKAQAAACGAESDAATAAVARARQFSLFNRRGRLVENLDMLWGEISELKHQQTEIKMLLQQLLRHQQLQSQQPPQQQQRSMVAAGAEAVGPGAPVSRSGGNGSFMRGAAALPSSERPASGMAAPRSRGPWD